MTDTVEWAYAKLNLSLDVTGAREDGYHDMAMVMQTVSLTDEIRIQLNNTGRISASSNLRFIPHDQRNLAVKAALRYLERVGKPGQGMSIALHKDIPVGAGMAGGSSDAAAVLRGLNRLYGGRLSRTELEELAAQIGSDVAFCVSGGTALAQGRGERLRTLPPVPACAFVICKPGFSISTPELFRKLDRRPLRAHPDTAGILEAIDTGDLKGLCRRMYNVFEEVDDRRMRTVREIKSALLDRGALGAVMTGTGSAVFGVFERQDQAETAARELGRDYRFCRSALPVDRLDIQ